MEILPHNYSDHCPILLRSLLSDFGPTSFRFFNSWLGDKGLEYVVRRSWQSSKSNWSTATPMSRHAMKIKHFKNCVKTWRSAKKNDKSKIDVLQKKIQELDLKAESFDLSREEQELLMEEKTNMFEEEKKELLDIKQKAHI